MSNCLLRRHLLKARTICRYCSKQPEDHLSPPGKLKRYFINRFSHYVERYENFLGKKYPKVFQVYSTFKVGIPGLIQDTQTYYQVSREIWKGQGLHCFKRKELEVYRQMPREMVKATPLLVISALPMGGIIFYVAYLFPRLLLTTHFWTPQQKQQFSCYYLKHQLEHFPGVLDHMYHQIRHIDNPSLSDKLLRLLHKLEHSVPSQVSEILEVKPLFESFPYHLDRISIAYTRKLGKSLDMSLRRSKLFQDALLLLHTDLAMIREGMDNLSDEELERACFRRALNPYGLKREERIDYLQMWMKISENIDENSLSLLLHSPVLLAYNHPTNRNLMGSQKIRWRRKKHF